MPWGSSAGLDWAALGLGMGKERPVQRAQHGSRCCPAATHGVQGVLGAPRRGTAGAGSTACTAQRAQHGTYGVQGVLGGTHERALAVGAVGISQAQKDDLGAGGGEGGSSGVSR